MEPNLIEKMEKESNFYNIDFEALRGLQKKGIGGSSVGFIESVLIKGDHEVFSLVIVYTFEGHQNSLCPMERKTKKVSLSKFNDVNDEITSLEAIDMSNDL